MKATSSHLFRIHRPTGIGLAAGGLLLAVLLALVSLGGMQARAADYNVSASVAYEVPTQPAVITSHLDGATVSDAQQQLKGTCQATDPAAVISVWRDSQLLGSVSCVSGTFELQVMLTQGKNKLLLRTSNISGVYGPDSLLLTLTLASPVTAQPLPTAVLQPATPAQQTTATNQGSLADLTLSTPESFSVLPNDRLVTLRVVVGGGQQPYVLQLNWGDGSTESHNVDQPGTYQYTHEYKKKGGYSVHLKLRDVEGAYTEYEYAVVSRSSSQTPASVDTDGASKTMSQLCGEHTTYFYFIVAVLLAAVFIVLSYWLGYRLARRRYLSLIETAADQTDTAADVRHKGKAP